MEGSGFRCRVQGLRCRILGGWPPSESLDSEP